MTVQEKIMDAISTKVSCASESFMEMYLSSASSERERDSLCRPRGFMRYVPLCAETLRMTVEAAIKQVVPSKICSEHSADRNDRPHRGRDHDGNGLTPLTSATSPL